MNALRRILLLCVASGLLAVTWALAPAASGNGAAREPGARAISAGFPSGVEAALPTEDGQVRVVPDGDRGPDPCPPSRGWALPRCAPSPGPRVPALDERSLLVQSHRRVNGSADAHGARA